MKNRDIIRNFDRTGLRRALWLLRRQDSHPRESNPAAAQFDAIATTSSMIRAEYRRRGWKVPKPTRAERAERF